MATRDDDEKRAVRTPIAGPGSGAGHGSAARAESAGRGPAKARSAERQARLAEELRANLRRRKAQARRREAAEGPGEPPGGEPSEAKDDVPERPRQQARPGPPEEASASGGEAGLGGPNVPDVEAAGVRTDE